MKVLLPAFAALALALASPALAQDLDCDNAMTQTDLNQCANLDFELADEALNDAWKIVHKQIGERDNDEGSGVRKLLAAQRTWLAYRDAHCDSVGDAYEGGSMQPMIVAGCRAGLTAERTQHLLELIEEE